MSQYKVIVRNIHGNPTAKNTQGNAASGIREYIRSPRKTVKAAVNPAQMLNLTRKGTE
jgi:hypothetical protein